MCVMSPGNLYNYQFHNLGSVWGWRQEAGSETWGPWERWTPLTRHPDCTVNQPLTDTTFTKYHQNIWWQQRNSNCTYDLFMQNLSYIKTVENIGHIKSLKDDYHDHELKRDSFPLPYISPSPWSWIIKHKHGEDVTSRSLITDNLSTSAADRLFGKHLAETGWRKSVMSFYCSGGSGPVS